MIAVDTNILLRFILRDDEGQFVKSSAFMTKRSADDPAFISLIVLAELAWALRQRYGYSRLEVRAAVIALIESAELAFEDEDALAMVVSEAVHGDLADHLIAYSAARAGCSEVVTFDRDASKAIPSMQLLS